VAFDIFFPPTLQVVIEYVGELIRQSVADVREKRYERSGIGSCYMFRLSREEIVDATVRGNIARYINHCCEPNCDSEIVTINDTDNAKAPASGEQKIVIIARRTIEVGQEVTYDYKFPIEDEKITCNCGAPNCIGRMN
jgi:SET domain-containing protein